MLSFSPWLGITPDIDLKHRAWCLAVERFLEQDVTWIRLYQGRRDPEDYLRWMDALINTFYRHQVVVDWVLDGLVAAERFPAAACYLDVADLPTLEKPVRAKLGCRWMSSCHNVSEIELAQQHDLDAVFISPVRKTATHPEMPALGWDGFARLAKRFTGPSFALGGVHRSDLVCAKEHGGYGVAGMRAWWDDLGVACSW